MNTRSGVGGWLRRIGIVVVCWFLVARSAPEAQAHSPQVPDFATYQRWVREAAIAARRGERFSLERIAPRMLATNQVMLPEGTMIPVDNQWLRNALEQPEPDLDRIATMLETLLLVLQQPPGSFPPDALQQLAILLRHPPFAEAEVPESGWWESLIGWLIKLVEPFLEPQRNPAKGPITTVVVGMLVALTAVVMGWVILLLVRGMHGTIWREARTPMTSETQEFLTSTAALREAQHLAKLHDYRMAIRSLYLASLLWLEERNCIPRNPTLTNREHLDQVSDPQLRSHLQPIVETFERVWYGSYPVDATLFAEYQQQVERLRSIP